MKRVLLTGMSGTGKSTVIRRLTELGYKAIDTDVLFVSGCARNQVKFYPQFDHVILLSAPAGLIVDRLATRTTNLYGKRQDELADVLQLLQTAQPMLRRAASLEVDTSVPVNDVVRTILDAVRRPAGTD